MKIEDRHAFHKSKPDLSVCMRKSSIKKQSELPGMQTFQLKLKLSALPRLDPDQTRHSTFAVYNEIFKYWSKFS